MIAKEKVLGSRKPPLRQNSGKHVVHEPKSILPLVPNDQCLEWEKLPVDLCKEYGLKEYDNVA